MWLLQVQFPNKALRPEEVAPYEALKAVTKKCLCVDPQQRMKALHMAEVLMLVADQAGWV